MASDDIQWWQSSLKAKCGLGIVSIDARPVVLLIPCVLVQEWWFFYLVLFIIGMFVVAQFFGYKFVTAIRKIRVLISGKQRYVRYSKTRRRRFYSES